MIDSRPMTYQVLRDPHLNAEFKQNGFVVIRGFLNNLESTELLNFYLKNPSENHSGFHTTLHSKNGEYRKSVNRMINSIFQPKADKFLNNYRSVFSCFTVKEPDNKSGFDLHLDWSMVDEKEHTSVTIWSPLIDIDALNGHFWALKGSNQFEFTLRGGPGLNLWCSSSPQNWSKTTYDQVSLFLLKGDAIIYDHRLFHGSPPNESNGLRVAINFSSIPQEAKSVHYRFEQEGTVSVYETPVDFYLTHILNAPPKGIALIDKYPINGSFLNQADVNTLRRL